MFQYVRPKYLNICFELDFELRVLFSVSRQQRLDLRLILILPSRGGVPYKEKGGRRRCSDGVYLYPDYQIQQ